MTFSIIILVISVLIVVPLLFYNSASLKAQARNTDLMWQTYAAEAAIKRVIADLERGADGIPTVYVTTSPHSPNANYQTFYTTTTYTIPSPLNLNGYSAQISISSPPPGVMPALKQQYVDPGLNHPYLSSVAAGYGYLMRIFNSTTGTLQVNWAYAPAGISRVGIWNGFPVDNQTQLPFEPGRITKWPTDPPILDTGNSPANATSTRTIALSIGPGVYSIVFDNTRGTSSKTTKAFAPTGGPDDTWIYAISYKDYLLTGTSGSVTVKAYVRQIPGYTQPPTGDWSITNPSFLPNNIYIHSWVVQ